MIKTAKELGLDACRRRAKAWNTLAGALFVAALGLDGVLLYVAWKSGWWWIAFDVLANGGGLVNPIAVVFALLIAVLPLLPGGLLLWLSTVCMDRGWQHQDLANKKAAESSASQRAVDGTAESDRRARPLRPLGTSRSGVREVGTSETESDGEPRWPRSEA